MTKLLQDQLDVLDELLAAAKRMTAEADAACPAYRGIERRQS